VSVSTGLTVSSGGSLDTNCQALTGAGTFTLSAGATLLICDANGISASGATGAVQTTGTRTFDTDASYVYNGTALQFTGTGLPATVRNLTTTNNNALDLINDLAVTRTLTVAGAGDFTIDGPHLTLLSSAAGTALVVNSGTGTVIGSEATVQRYLTTTNPGRGYRHYSSPVNGNRLSDLGTATFTPVFSAAYNTATTAPLAAGFPTVLGYDQSRMTTTAYAGFDRGWFSPAATDLMGTGTGYAVNLNGTELVDFTGTLNTGNYARALPRATGTVGGEGLHLVGNPYPAPIDWSLVNATTDRPNLDAAFYVFASSSQYGGSYRSAVNGIGSSNFIGSSQGFFVRVTPGQPGGTLIFKNTHRLTDYAQQVAVRRGGADLRPQLRLTLAGTGTGAASDDFHLYAQTGATPGTDAEFDAVKLTNPTGLNLASLTATGQALAIDGRADFGTAAALRVPLQVSVPAAGSYTFTAAAVANLPAGTTATLVDNLTGTRTALTPGAAYRFATATTTAPGRFWLNLTPAAAPLANAPAALAAQVLTYPNPTTGRLTVVRPVGATATAVLLNALGQTVRTLALPTAETALDLRGLATGVYTLRLTLDGQPVSKRVVLE